jgi:23S rRNA (uracil1939-C5)-methyltransferase
MNQTDQPTTLKRGAEVVLRAESAAFEGGCVARHEGMAVFVSGCVPGDLVRAMVMKGKKKYAEARTVEVLERSADRVVPVCRYFGTCGGCKWQNLRYDEQLRWKRQHVVDAFERIGGLEGVEVRASVGCREEYFYRNKMEFSFSSQRWLTEEEIGSAEEFSRDFALGLHVPGRYDKVLDIDRCWLQSDTSVRIVNSTREFVRRLGIPPYNTHQHDGVLRNLVIRQSRATSEIMVILVTAGEEEEWIGSYADHLRAAVPEVTTLVQGINRKKAQIAFSEETRTLYGPGTITEEVAGNRFTISPFSFFQTNSLQAERLYTEALEAAAITSDEIVWDLYCGAGTITLAAARGARSAIGIELNEGAILDARANAIRNGIENARFVVGDLKDTLNRDRAGQRIPEDQRSETEHPILPQPDVVIVDPPRAGMHEDVVRRLLELAPRRIIYVSCNPTTQARDCKILSEAYRIEYVQPVDMFPQTYHVETVAKLEKIF